MFLNVKEGIVQAKEGMSKYLEGVSSCRIAFSGGKDSTALATLIMWMFDSREVSFPDRVFLVTSDTRQELPPLIENADYVSQMCKSKFGWDTIKFQPSLENTFLYHLLGRGLFTPGSNGRNRWCTRVLKTDPMDKSHSVYAAHGINVKDSLLLYGSRIDESNVRGLRMLHSCALEGSECGTGLYTINEGAKYAPLTNWRNCATWDWLLMARSRIGYDPRLLMDLYGSVEAKDVLDDPDKYSPEKVLDAIDATTRTGCIGCPVVGHDYALERVCTWPRWAHLRPFIPLRDLYVSLRGHEHRLRKPPGEKNSRGEDVYNQGRVGPICLASRRDALEKIKAMQIESNLIADKIGVPRFILLSDELANLIDSAIKRKVFPRGWSGDEPLALDTRPVGVRILDAFTRYTK